MPTKKKHKNDSNIKQISFSAIPGLVVKRKYSKYIGVDLLMTDAIYGSRIPADAKG